MNWRTYYDKDYQVRNRRGNRFFFKTNDLDTALEAQQMGRQRSVWRWSDQHLEYQPLESPCSNDRPSNP